nr:MAG TPA: hypothetical protein [Caudoviricetes sp.]
MIRFIKSKIYEKKFLRNQLYLSEGLNQKLIDANKKQQEDIKKLKEKIEEFQTAEDEYIFNAEELKKEFQICVCQYQEKIIMDYI